MAKRGVTFKKKKSHLAVSTVLGFFIQEFWTVEDKSNKTSWNLTQEQLHQLRSHLRTTPLRGPIQQLKGGKLPRSYLWVIAGTPSRNKVNVFWSSSGDEATDRRSILMTCGWNNNLGKPMISSRSIRPPELDFFKIGHHGLFYFNFVLPIVQLVDKIMPISGFEPRISGIRSDRSTNHCPSEQIFNEENPLKFSTHLRSSKRNRMLVL